MLEWTAAILLVSAMALQKKRAYVCVLEDNLKTNTLLGKTLQVYQLQVDDDCVNAS